MKRVRISTAERIAPQKPPGYLDALRAVGIPAGDDMLHITDEDYADIAARFPTTIRGAGDAVAVVAQPIARGIDYVFKTDIANCGGCKKRQAALNKAIPFTRKSSAPETL